MKYVCQFCGGEFVRKGNRPYSFCSSRCYGNSISESHAKIAATKSKPCACGCGGLITQGKKTTQWFDQVKYLPRHHFRDPEFLVRRKEGLVKAFENGKMNHVKHQSPEFIERRIRPLRGRKKSSEACALLKGSMEVAWKSGKFVGTRSEAGPNHHGGRIWRLRSPDNEIFEFRNLSEFVRTHPHLFAPEDLVVQPYGKCRAVAGLQAISARNSNAAGVWKGWTWFSQTERIKNGGKDLLDRPDPNMEGASVEV